VKSAKKVVCSGVMRRKPASSARSVALVAAFCALAVAAGCGRVPFDLVPEQTLDSAAAGHGAGTLDVSLGGNSLASAGKAGGGSAGKAGSGGSGGSGGRVNNPATGGSSTFPCLGEGGCADEACPPYSSSPFCNGCFTDDDCASNDDAKVCNTETKRCVQCGRESNNCGAGKACNLFTQRCATWCERKDDCGADTWHRFCDLEHHVCVACNQEVDCKYYGDNLHCAFSTCAECFDESQCSFNQECILGHCVKR
jgi:hypothetical protein